MVANRDNFPKHYYTLEEYFALEHGSDARFEYWDGDIVCMSGGSKRHYRITRNVFFRMHSKLDGGRCEAFTADMPVKTPTLPPYRYPDALVVCGEAHFEKLHGIDALTNPVLIVEVASPSTAGRDEFDKFKAYQALATFTEYLLISQDSIQIAHHTKQPDGRWSREVISDLAAIINLTSIDCSVSVSEIYKGVSFEDI